MKAIFDTDPGIDDAMALIYLHGLREKIELLGITTILGNASIEDCTRNARYLCDQFGIDTPVYQGSGVAVDGTTPDDYPDFVHGANGLGDVDIPEPATSLQPESAVDYLINASMQHEGELTLLAVGRLTNVALAMQADSEFAGRLKHIIIMGGAWQCEGNVTPFAEANIIGDPEAAKIVFDSGVPLVMVGLDVTMKTRFTREFLKDLCSELDELGEFLYAINRAYAAYHKTSMDWDESPVHDPSAIAYADNPSLFTTAPGRLDCVLEGEERGRTVFIESGDGPHKVCIDVDSDALIERYRNVLTHNEQTQAH